VSEADVELLTMAVVGPLNVVLPLLLVSLDFRLLLTVEQRARTWPDATIGAAALLIGPLLLPIHFAMSRWVGHGSGWGCLLSWSGLRDWGWRVLLTTAGLALGMLLLGVVLGINYVVAAVVQLLAMGRVQGS